MGNAKAKRLYEAFLPECFQRPETDQSAESFIRDKYDKKKYMDKVIDIQMLRVSPHIQRERAKLCACASNWIGRQEKVYCARSFYLKYLQQNHYVLSVQKEKSCDNIPKEPVVFEKMKLVSASSRGHTDCIRSKLVLKLFDFQH